MNKNENKLSCGHPNANTKAMQDLIAKGIIKGHCGFCYNGSPSPPKANDPDSFSCDEPHYDMNEQRANVELTYYVRDPTKCGNCRYFGTDGITAICQLSPNIKPNSAHGICDEWGVSGWTWTTDRWSQEQ